MLLERHRNGDAVAIFQLNAREFPDSWNAYDSLAEACLQNGEVERARANYLRSLELNPGNEGAKAALERLPPPALIGK